MLAYDVLALACLITGFVMLASACDGLSQGDKVRFWVLTPFGLLLVLGAVLVVIKRIILTF